MKYLIPMLSVLIFTCAMTAQKVPYQGNKIGHVWSSETWGQKELAELAELKQKGPIRHDVPIVCGEGDGKCGVKDCKCSCHKKDARKHSHKKAAPKGRPGVKGKRGARAKGKRGGRSIRGRSSRSSGKRSTSRRSSPPSRRGRPTKKAQDGIDQTDRKKWVDAIKKKLQNSNKLQGDALRKRIQEFRKNNTIPQSKSISSHWLIAK